MLSMRPRECLTVMTVRTTTLVIEAMLWLALVLSVVVLGTALGSPLASKGSDRGRKDRNIETKEEKLWLPDTDLVMLASGDIFVRSNKSEEENMEREGEVKRRKSKRRGKRPG